VRKCQFKDLDEKKRYDTRSPNGHLHEKPSEKRRNKEKMPVLTLVPGSQHEHHTSRKRVMCGRNTGAHVGRSIRSTKGIKTG
jgi:hypothetical protein